MTDLISHFVVKSCVVSTLLLLVSGCSSISKGVAEAILEQKTADTRKCRIEGSPFPGIAQSLQAQNKNTPDKTTKILAVHGISHHIPGYSTHFKDQLTHTLNLNISSSSYKEILIQSEDSFDENGQPENIGTLHITRHQDSEQQQTLLFYELTWSQISDPARRALEYDSSGQYNYHRARINQALKEFINDAVPDLMAYRGTSKQKINQAVSQAVCWTFYGDWDDLPDSGSHYCDIRKRDFSKHLMDDDYFFVTHSLGSRITVDTLAYAAELSEQLGPESPKAKKLFDVLKNKKFQVYMLSNQLPLLQLGMEKPPVVGQHDAYCTPSGAHYNERIFKQINLIAFSDPNDVLSYPIPPNYEKHSLDSRLCANIVNVNINVAYIKKAFELDFANPIEAHNNYWGDRRVSLIVRDGMSRTADSDKLEHECSWIETRP